MLIILTIIYTNTKTRTHTRTRTATHQILSERDSELSLLQRYSYIHTNILAASFCHCHLLNINSFLHKFSLILFLSCYCFFAILKFIFIHSCLYNGLTYARHTFYLSYFEKWLVVWFFFSMRYLFNAN